MNINDAIHTRLLLFDGAMGTRLQEKGLLGGGDCPEQLLFTHPLDVMDIHADYTRAGADVVTANTFGANPITLGKYGLASRLEELITSAVAIAREAVAAMPHRVYVAASLGPTGQLLQPAGTLAGQQAYDAYFAAASAMGHAGADLILIETMSDVNDARLALLAARAACRLPVAVSFTFENNGRTLMGNPPEVAALIAYRLGAVMQGVNCSGGPEQLLSAFQTLLLGSPLPTLAMPNAGLPQMVDGKLSYPYTAQQMHAAMPAYLDGGASALGGCCGTTAQHIAALRHLIDGRPAPAPRAPGESRIASTRRTLPLSAVYDAAPIRPDDDVEDAVGTLMEQQAELLHIDLCDRAPAYVTRLIRDLMPLMPGTPLCFSVNHADQARAALFEYPGIAAVFAQGDADSVARECARFGAEMIQ